MTTPSERAAAITTALERPKRDGVRRSPKISEIVARELANHIITQGLPEGTMLPNERELIEVFGVGRTTLREALRLLETRGVLAIRSGPKGGPVVKRPKASDLSDALTLILQFEGATMRDVSDARRAAEPMIARRAAERVTEELLAELQDSIDAMVSGDPDPAAFVRENSRFHAAIADSADSVVLRVFLGSVRSIVDREIVGDLEYTKRQRRAVAAAHQKIVDALRDRDPDGAERAMREHLEESNRNWSSRFPHLLKAPVQWV